MIPNTVNVAGVAYSVEKITGLETDNGLLGQVIYSTSVIKLDDRLSKDRMNQVFIHELLHACFHEAGYEEQDEDMVNRVGIVLHQVLKENKLFFGEEEGVM